MLHTSETLPTSPHDRKVVLPGYELLYLLVVAVSEIRIMLIAKVNAQTLFGETNRPGDREGKFGCRSERKDTDLEYV